MHVKSNVFEEFNLSFVRVVIADCTRLQCFGTLFAVEIRVNKGERMVLHRREKKLKKKNCIKRNHRQ